MKKFRKNSKLTTIVTFLLAFMIQLTSFQAIPIQAAEPSVEDWSLEQQKGTDSDSAQAALFVREGDIDNFGNGWSGGFNPFEGQVGTVGAIDNSQSYNGTDNLASENAVKFEYTFNEDPWYYIDNARIEFYGTGFKAGNQYEVMMNGIRINDLEDALSMYNQEDNKAQFITFRLPEQLFTSLEKDMLNFEIKAFDSDNNPTNFAIDFAKLTIKPNRLKNTASIQGETYLADTYNAGAPDGSQGTFVPWVTINAVGAQNAWYAEEDAHYFMEVPAGEVVIIVSKLGYKTQVIKMDLKPGDNIEYDILLEYGQGYPDVTIGAKDIDSINRVRTIPRYVSSDDLAGEERVDKIFENPIVLAKDPNEEIDPSVDFDITGMQLAEKRYQFIKVYDPSNVPDLPSSIDPKWKDLGEGTNNTIDPNTYEAYPDLMWAERGHITVKNYEYKDKSKIFNKPIKYEVTKDLVGGVKNVLVASTNKGGYSEKDDDQPAFFENDSNASGKSMKAWGYIAPFTSGDYAFGIKANSGAYGYIEINEDKVVFADGMDKKSAEYVTTNKTVTLERGKVYPIYMEWFAEENTNGTFLPVYKVGNSWKEIDKTWFYASSNEGPANPGEAFESSALFKQVAFPKDSGYYYVAVRARSAGIDAVRHGLYGPFQVGDVEEPEEPEEEYRITLPEKITIYVGDNYNLKADVNPNNATIEWEIEDSSIANFNDSSTENKNRIINGLKVGTTYVRASMQGKTNTFATCQVEVIEEGIQLPDELYVRKGKMKSIQATNIPPGNNKIDWTVIEGEGYINDSLQNYKTMKITGKEVGMAVIKATVKGKKASSDTCRVYVYDYDPEGTVNLLVGYDKEITDVVQMPEGAPIKPVIESYDDSIVKPHGEDSIKGEAVGSTKVKIKLYPKDDDEDDEDDDSIIDEFDNIPVAVYNITYEPYLDDEGSQDNDQHGNLFPDYSTIKLKFNVEAPTGQVLPADTALTMTPDLSKISLIDFEGVKKQGVVKDVQFFKYDAGVRSKYEDGLQVIEDNDNKIKLTLGDLPNGIYEIVIGVDLNSESSLSISIYNGYITDPGTIDVKNIMSFDDMEVYLGSDGQNKTGDGIIPISITEVSKIR